MKDIVKEIKDLIVEKKIDEAKKLIPKAQKAIDKTTKRGILKKNTASRKKSRLMKFINKKV